MRKSVEFTVFASIFFIWALSAVSIPFIPERCIVCGEQHGSSESETLRTQSVIEWAFNGTAKCHFSCFSKYRGEIHNPNGGIR